MATDSSHRVIIGGNLASTLAPPFLIGSSYFFAGNDYNYKISNGSEIQQDPTREHGVSFL